MALSKNKKGSDNPRVSIGDGIWCRHAKAGELCEHFNELICYRQSVQSTADGFASDDFVRKGFVSDETLAEKSEKINKEEKQQIMTTYRGEGKCFH